MANSIRRLAAGATTVTLFVLAYPARGGTEDTTDRQPQSGRAVRMQEMREACPERVPGTQTRTEEVKGGIAVSFVTDRADQVAELRRRVERLSQMHEEMRMSGGMHGRMHGDERDPTAGRGMDMERMAALRDAKTRVEEIPSGARIVITTESEADVESLREHVRLHVERMKSGECPMHRMMGPAQEMGVPPESL